MKHLALMLATASLLAACAAPSRRPSDEGPHDARVFTGRIDSVAGAAAIRTGSGAYRPGMGGALGGAVAGILQSIPVQNEHFTYSVMTNEGVIKPAPTADKFNVGDCVDAFVSKNKTGEAYWLFGEISLRPSKDCKGAA